jgi:hypothetical protein
MRTVLLVLTALIASAGLIGCGKSRAVGATVTGSNPEGVKATLVISRADDRWLEGRIRIENTGTSVIYFRNAAVGETVSGYRLEAGGLPGFGTYAGIWAKSGATKLRELAPGSSEDFEIRWKFVTAPKPAKNYSWTATITNLFAGERKAGDVVLAYTAAN